MISREKEKSVTPPAGNNDKSWDTDGISANGLVLVVAENGERVSLYLR